MKVIKQIPVSYMNGTPLNLDCEIVDSIDDDGTQDQDGTEDDADDDDIGQIRSLSGS